MMEHAQPVTISSLSLYNGIGIIFKERRMENVFLILACMGVAFWISQGVLTGMVRSKIILWTRPSKQKIEEWQAKVQAGDHSLMDWQPSFSHKFWLVIYAFLSRPASVGFVVGLVGWVCGLHIIDVGVGFVSMFLTGFMLFGLCHIVFLWVGNIKQQSGQHGKSGGCKGNHQGPKQQMINPSPQMKDQMIELFEQQKQRV